MIDLQFLIRNEGIQFLLIFIEALLIAELVNFSIKFYFKKLALKTKTNLDDKIIGMITKPFYVFIIIWGLYLGTKVLSFFGPYLDYINRTGFVLLVLSAAFLISRVINILINKGLKVQKKYEKTPQLFNKLVSVSVYAIAIITILGYFKIEITPLLAALGVGGLAVGLALQSTLSNLFAGLHIMSDKPIEIGDFIELDNGNLAGYVQDINWRTTRIKTWDNNYVIIPNAKLADSIILNDSMPKNELSFLVECGVSYGENLKKVEKVTLEVAKKIQENTQGAVSDFEPSMMFYEFGDSNINFRVVLRAKSRADKFLIRHEFIKELKTRFDKEKIEISWPVRKVYMSK